MSSREVRIEVPGISWLSSVIGISEEYSIEIPLDLTDTQSDKSIFVEIELE